MYLACTVLYHHYTPPLPSLPSPLSPPPPSPPISPYLPSSPLPPRTPYPPLYSPNPVTTISYPNSSMLRRVDSDQQLEEPSLWGRGQTVITNTC